MERILRRIYGRERGGAALERLERILHEFKELRREPGKSFSQEDMVLITYGDSLSSERRAPLKALHRQFPNRYKEIRSEDDSQLSHIHHRSLLFH